MYFKSKVVDMEILALKIITIMEVEDIDPSASVLVGRGEKSNINIKYDLKEAKVEFDLNVIVLVARGDISNVKKIKKMNKAKKQ
jgi:hypothetical protein